MKKHKSNSSSNSTSIDWKAKSIKRGKEAKALNKRIRELTLSRDNWKNKYLRSKQECEKWNVELVKIKKN